MAAVTSCENALLSSWKTQAWEFLGCIDTIPDSSYGDRKKIPDRVSVQQHIRTMILSRFLQRREPAAEPPRRSWKWIVTNRIGFCHCSSQCKQVFRPWCSYGGKESANESYSWELAHRIAFVWLLIFLHIGNEKETHDSSNTVLKESISNDRTLKVRYRPVTALRGCLISLKEIYSKGKRDKNQQILKVSDDFQINEHDLQHWINLLRILTKGIPRHLSTMHETWITKIQFNQYPAEKTQQWLSVILQRMLFDPTEGGTSRLTQSTVVMKGNSDQGDGK